MPDGLSFRRSAVTSARRHRRSGGSAGTRRGGAGGAVALVLSAGLATAWLAPSIPTRHVESRGTAVACDWDVRTKRRLAFWQSHFLRDGSENGRTSWMASRQPSWHRSRLGGIRLGMTQCDDGNCDGDGDGPGVDAAVYEPMALPDRARAGTHAVFGALLNGAGSSDCIRSFRAYRNRRGGADGEVVMARVALGYGLDGHEGTVHGGILALLIDDTLGFAVIEALGVPFAVTANLTVDYRRGVPSGSRVRIRALLQEWKERKLVWRVVVESDDDAAASEDGPRTLYCEATSVFVIPRDVYEEMNQTAVPQRL